MKYDFAVKTYITDARKTDDDKLIELYEGLSVKRRQKADNCKVYQDKKRSILAGALADAAMGELLPVSRPQILFTDKGKPYLEGRPIDFNISHSGDFVICSVSPLETGCDIERKANRCGQIAKRFFNLKENEYIFGKDIPDKEALNDCDAQDDLISGRFLDVWTMKEALLKAAGVGIGYPLDDFCVVKDGSCASSLHFLYDDRTYYFKNTVCDENYRISVCSLYDRFEENITEIDFLH